MKNSGIEWIGEMPERWEICKVKQCATNEKTLFNDGDWIESPYITDSGIMLIQTGNIGEGFYKEQGYRFISEETFHKLQCKYVYPNDILISRLASPVGRACLAPNLEDKMICSVDVCILRVNSDIDRRYLNYYFALNGYIEHTDLIARGTTLQRISRTQLGNILVILPSFPEQQAIADYLDTKCNLIYSTIEKQKTVIEKLQSYKQSLITEAVIKGLDPNAKMKPSGIEWIGDIPNGWEVKPIGKIAKVSSSKRVFEEDYVHDGIPFYRSKEIVELSKGLETSAEIYISEVVYNLVNSKSEAPKAGDLLLTSIGTIGLTWICDERTFYYKDGNITQIKANTNNNTRFIEYCFKSNMVFEQYNRLSAGSTILALTIVKIKKMVLTYPPLLEQQEIANYLDNKCAKIDNIINGKQKLLDKLTDYKKSLIYECVTGKKEIAVNA